MPEERRRFRFGVLSKGGSTRREWLELARRCEGLGFATLVLPEHSRPQFAPFPALVSAAEVTSLRVGTLVANNDLRHPMVLAREAATVDLLTDGRFELGIGAGWMPRDYDETGVPFDTGAVRARRLEESLALIRQLLADETVSTAGSSYRVEGLTGGPTPVQHPLPILVGAGGPRVLSIAARFADIVGITRSMGAGPSEADAARDGTFAATAAKVAHLRRAAGDRFASIELNVLLTVVDLGPGASSTRDRIAAATGLSPEDVVTTPQHLFGSVSEAVEHLLARREQLGLSYVVVRDADIDGFAPVVSALAGQ